MNSDLLDPTTYQSPDRPAAGGKSARSSVYLGPHLQRLQAACRTSTFSYRVEESVRRLSSIAHSLVPKDWAMSEWAVLVMALQYVDADEEERAWSTLLGWGFRYGAQVMSQYNLDVEHLARQLRDVGPAVNVAVVELVTCYWDLPENLTHAQRLEMLGLIRQPSNSSED